MFFVYNVGMTVTVEIIKQGTLSLLNDLENLGLIHVKSSSPQSTTETVNEDSPPYMKLYGIHKNIKRGSVDDFLADCREDKERELTMEKRQEEERERLAKTKLSS